MTQTDPVPAKPAVELALGQRQIAALGFVAILMLGCVATLAYVAGRSNGPAQSAANSQSAVRSSPRPTPALPPPAAVAAKIKPATNVEQLIMVEPASAAPVAAPPSVMALRAAQPLPPRQSAEQPALSKAPELQPLAPQLLAGRTFWQVAATDKGMSEVTCELLVRKGLPALIGDSPSPGIYRVLVGPVHSTDETARYKVVLDESGFHPFIKKY